MGLQLLVLEIRCLWQLPHGIRKVRLQDRGRACWQGLPARHHPLQVPPLRLRRLARRPLSRWHGSMRDGREREDGNSATTLRFFTSVGWKADDDRCTRRTLWAPYAFNWP